MKRTMNYKDREAFLKNEIKHWGNCLGCTITDNGFKTEWNESVELHIKEFTALVVFRFNKEVEAIYRLDLETGLALMLKNEFLPGGKFDNESGGLIADFFGPIWSNNNDDGVFQLMNPPLIVDTDAPVIKPMPIEDIVREIVNRISTSIDEEVAVDE